ncbi:MAG: tetratricopeptide repeat protein [Verrucomicrobiales bacterium]|nr:tetratricopeptide repeat protein [Verrucomicrobiales bacterium]
MTPTPTPTPRPDKPAGNISLPPLTQSAHAPAKIQPPTAMNVRPLRSRLTLAPSLIAFLALLALFLASVAPLPTRAVPVTNQVDLTDWDFTLSNPFERSAETEVRAAFLLLNSGQLEPALQAAGRALERNPASADAHEIAGAALAKLGRFEDSLARLTKATELNPRQATAFAKLGDVQAALQHPGPARTAYLQALAIDPTDRRAHQRLGLMSEDEGDASRAIDHFEKGLEGTPPNYVGVKINLARLYNRANRFEQTIVLLAPVVPDTYPDPIAHLLLGTAYLGTTNLNAGLHSLEIMSRLRGRDATAQQALALAYSQAGQPAKALEILDALLATQPNALEARVQRAQTLAALNRPADALTEFQAALASQPKSIPTLLEFAAYHASHGAPNEAIRLYSSVLALPDAPALAYERLAAVQRDAGQLKEAETTLLAGCTRHPQHARLRTLLGLHYGLTQQYARSRDSLTEALAMAPGNPQALKALSGAHQRLGSLSNAVAAARQLVAVVPRNAEDRFYLGGLEQDAGELRAAIATYGEVLKLNPDHAAALNNLAHTLASEGHATEALPFAERALKLLPNNPSVLHTHGWVCLQAGAFPAAQKSLAQAARLAPGKPTYQFHLALAQKSSGDVPAARATLDALLALRTQYPERAEAQRLREQLR